VDAAAKAIDRFEGFGSFRPFKDFRAEHASAFRTHLLSHRTASGQALSKSTVVHTLNALKRFFGWLAGQSGYRKIEYAWSEYFTPSLKDLAAARAHRERRVPTVDQICSLVASMPDATPVQKRDRAVIALIALTGARDNAVASFKIKHIDVQERMLFQDGRTVRTKFSKTITTWFFPVSNDLERIVADWVGYARSVLHFGSNDPLFPATKRTLAASDMGSLGKVGWETAGPIRRIFKESFERAGMAACNPHSLRHMLVRLGMDVCRTPEEFKAWSQNLGHEGVLVTLNSYGDVPTHRQRELIHSFAHRSHDKDLALTLGLAVLEAARKGKTAV